MVIIDEERCKGCGLCIIFCKKNLLEYKEELNTSGYKPVKYKGEGCTHCSNCYLICPDAAIELIKS
jgi:2-oxoglutarate ferredoxin oxidoreductase subunit delta